LEKLSASGASLTLCIEAQRLQSNQATFVALHGRQTLPISVKAEALN
jgi:hypothetical protein